MYFLQSTLKAEQIGEITSDDLYIYSSPTLASRPITVIREGVLESLRFPSNTLFACQRLGAAHDLLLLKESSLTYTGSSSPMPLSNVCRTFKAQRLYTIGGYLDYAPHTRMPRLSAVVTHEALKDELEAYDVDLTDYEGRAYSHTSWQPVVPRALRGLVSGEVPQVTFRVHIHVSPKLCYSS